MDEIPPTTDDDRVHLIAACGGDLAAFSRLVLKYQWAVRAFLLTRLSRKHEAEDLAQETFLTAWKRLKDFDLTRPIGPWLRGIAENHLRNHLRKFRAEPIGGSEALQQILDLQTTSQQAPEAESELAVALADCIEQVDRTARELLIARYAEGRSMAEICKQTGKKHSAMTMKLHRLRLALAACVEGKLSQTI
jgi:RNA polymerase sigma-70 factor (ECF subfamily)